MDYWRQLTIIPPDKLEFPITLIGAGGIGSPTTLNLAKMGCKDLTVWDFDDVEEHNLPNQVYRLTDIGKPKVEALAEVVELFTGTKIKVVKERYVNQELSGVIIVCVDNMEARDNIWKSCRMKVRVPLYIDARMGGEIGLIYPLLPTDPTHIRFYEPTLFSDANASELPCTAQAVIYNVFGVASVITSLVKRFALNPEDLRVSKPEVELDFVNTHIGYTKV